MEEIIRRERAVRQQAQLAAEQALKAAKEAQKMILQLEEELDTKDQQLQQERAARQQAELAAQKAAQSAVRVVLEDVQDETITTIRETSEKQKSQSKCNAMVPKTEDEAALGAPIDASASGKCSCSFSNLTTGSWANSVRFVSISQVTAAQEGS
ncbi:hypothetical protein GQ600_19184 [Phytophthora cactorum]|nr:hypothetical protein GQ600_19184 [Phytophthora cactorum]